MENLSRRLTRQDGWVKEKSLQPDIRFFGSGRGKVNKLKADGCALEQNRIT